MKLNPICLKEEFKAMVASIVQKCCIDLILAVSTKENFMVYVCVSVKCLWTEPSGFKFTRIILLR